MILQGTVRPLPLSEKPFVDAGACFDLHAAHVASGAIDSANVSKGPTTKFCPWPKLRSRFDASHSRLAELALRKCFRCRKRGTNPGPFSYPAFRNHKHSLGVTRLLCFEGCRARLECKTDLIINLCRSTMCLSHGFPWTRKFLRSHSPFSRLHCRSSGGSTAFCQASSLEVCSYTACLELPCTSDCICIFAVEGSEGTSGRVRENLLCEKPRRLT